MAKWPKDSPGTWYSHYKRGSLVSGPACGARVLAEAGTLCALGSAWFWYCTAKYVYAVLWHFACWLLNFCGAWFSTSCTHLQSNNIGDALIRKWRRGLWTIQTGFNCDEAAYLTSNGGKQYTAAPLRKFLTVYPLCHTSATLREHRLRVTVRLDSLLTKEASVYL